MCLGQSMTSSDIVERIKQTIEELAIQIREHGDFNENTILNVHGLVCLMRYAIWKDEELFKNWVLNNCEFEINEGILQRVFLHKSVEDNDGVEIRIHVFPYGQATFIHNHQQDFITMCILGSYEYCYYDIDNTKNDHTYKKFIRIPKKATILPHPDCDDDGNMPGLIVKARYENGELIQDPDMNDMLFKQGDLPMFVPHDIHHTVNQKEEDLVITIVARRGKRRPETSPTTVLQDKNQNHRDPVEDQKPIIRNHEIPIDKKDEIYNSIKKALLMRGFGLDKDSDVPNRNKSDLSSYMIKSKYVAKFTEDDTEDDENLRLISRFMKSNDFTSVPVLSGKKCVKILRLPVSSEHESGTLLTRKPQPIDIDEHIFGAILWNLVSRDLVVPIVNKAGEFQGILSISDLVHSNEDFDRSLIYSIAKKRRDDNGEKTARSFLRRIKRFEGRVFGEEKLSRDEIDELVNDVLLKLGPLIVISPDLPHGRLKDVNSTLDNQPWAVKSAHWPFYKFKLDDFSDNEISSALQLLKMLERGSDMSQILVQSGNETKLLKSSGEMVPFAISPLDITMQSTLDQLSSNDVPLILQKGSKFGILTTDDLGHESAIQELSKLVISGNLSIELKESVTKHIIRVTSGIDSTLRL